MKNRRLLILITNLIAAGAIAGSAFLQWFNGVLPSQIEAHTIANFIPISVNYSRATIATNFTVSIALFVAAFFFLVAGLLAKKSFSVLGSAMSAGILVLWFISSNLGLEIFENVSNLVNQSIFGLGVITALTATIIGIISVLIPKKRRAAPPSA